MNVNLFFLFLIAGLITMLVYFKPLKIKEQTFVNLPQLELKNFTYYELGLEGLKRVMKAEKSVVFSDKYEVYSIDYTDNLNDYKVNIHSDYASYHKGKVLLNGNVEFNREDGFIFQTQSAIYDKKQNMLTIDKKYTSTRGKDSLSGSSLKYNDRLNKIQSSNVTIVYQLEESF